MSTLLESQSPATIKMKIKSFTCGIALAAALFGCATGSAATTASTAKPMASNTTSSGNTTTSGNVTVAGNAPAPGNTTAAPNGTKPAEDHLYYLHPLDTISIIVVDDARANQEALKIGADGMVKLAYLDDSIMLKGLTTTEASKKIADAYKSKKIYVNPQINVAIKDYFKQHFSVIGQVARSGTYEIPPEETMTLAEAFTTAGGPTRISDTGCSVTRTNPDGKTQTIELDLWGACHGDVKANIVLQDKDIIDVHESAIGSRW